MAKKKKMSEPEFLKIILGSTVLVGDDQIAKILSFVEGARDPNDPRLFNS